MERPAPDLDLLFDDPLEYLAALAGDPLGAHLHLNFALFCLSRGNLDLGFAELRSARHLGVEHPELDELIGRLETREIALEELDHNQYYRLTTLAQAVVDLSATPEPSVLDIGGGQGLLARFLPETSYCLVEPEVNGISALALPFEEKSFDFVVACHVLEHIPEDRRDLFLDQLCATGRRHVIILNPFHLPGAREKERLKLIYELTGAGWAREHLECSLPHIETVREYAARRGYPVEIRPNGAKSTSFAVTLINHFANQSGSGEELRRINRFLNTRLAGILQNDAAPNAYLVQFDVSV